MVTTKNIENPIPQNNPIQVRTTFCVKPKTAKIYLPKIDNGVSLLNNQTLCAPPEIVAGVLHKNTKGILAGSSKVGKTWMLLDLAVSISTGKSFLKWETTPAKVLFINYEIPQNFFKDRLAAVTKEKNITSNIDNLDIWNLRSKNPDLKDMTDDLISRVGSEAYSLIILDPAYKMLAGRSENSSTSVGIMCHNIENLMQKTDAAVVYAHHFTKGNQSRKKAMDRMSGSGILARDADTMMLVTEHEKANCYTIEMNLRNLAPQDPFVVQWEYPLMKLRNDLDPSKLKTTTPEEPDDIEDAKKLLEFLANGPLTTTEWQRAAHEEGVSRATFFRWMDKLKSAYEAIQNEKTKTWSLAGSGEGVDASETSETAVVGETTPAPVAGIESESP